MRHLNANQLILLLEIYRRGTPGIVTQSNLIGNTANNLHGLESEGLITGVDDSIADIDITQKGKFLVTKLIATSRTFLVDPDERYDDKGGWKVIFMNTNSDVKVAEFPDLAYLPRKKEEIVLNGSVWFVHALFPDYDKMETVVNIQLIA